MRASLLAARHMLGPLLCISLGVALVPFASLAQETSPGAGRVFSPAPTVLAPEDQQLLDIAQAGDRIVAVGAAGLITYSDDQGSTWQQAAVPVSATLTAVSFPTDREGWAAGHAGVILHTEDAGSNWKLQFDGMRANRALLDFARGQRVRLENELQAMEAAMEDGGQVDAAARDDLEYALEDAIFLEEDAQLAIETGPADPFLDVQFFDERRGWAVGAYGMAFYTEDGGENWLAAYGRIANADRFHLYGIHLEAPDTVYLAGEAGLLFLSRDAGLSFRRFEDVYEGSLFGVLPLGDDVITFGLRGNLFALDVQQSEAMWEPLATDNQVSLYGGGALDDGGALLLGAGGTVLRVAGDGTQRAYQHPGRSTFSAALEAADGTLWLVGMDGLARLSEAEAR